MDLKPLNPVEQNALEAMVNFKEKAKLIQISQRKVGCIEDTPSRLAVVEALAVYPPTIGFLPNQLQHIGVECKNLDMWTYINYISSGFMEKHGIQVDGSVPNVRILPYHLLPQYARVCAKVGHPIDPAKIRAHYSHIIHKGAPKKKRVVDRKTRAKTATKSATKTDTTPAEPPAEEEPTSGIEDEEEFEFEEEGECQPSTSGPVNHDRAAEDFAFWNEKKPSENNLSE